MRNRGGGGGQRRGLKYVGGEARDGVGGTGGGETAVR